MRPPAPAPERSQVEPGAVAVPETGSEKVTVIWSAARETADDMDGAMRSETRADWSAMAIPLASASLTSGEPEGVES